MNALLTEPNNPYVQIADACDLGNVALLRDGNYYMLQQLPLETIEVLPIEVKARRGFPTAWADIGPGIRLWPVPDAAYEVCSVYSERLIARRKRLERDAEIFDHRSRFCL